jgi:release factor glutamine methyltransferase
VTVEIRQRLSIAGIKEAGIESELLISNALGLSKEKYFSELNTRIDVNDICDINRVVRRRINREPFPYIAKRRQFYGLDLYVDKRVLIPRQETEMVVDKAIKFLKLKKAQPIKILDLCTGSGAIAISLAKFFPKAKIYATDISEDALDVAKINCHTHNVDQIINLICLDSLKGFNETVDLVVANPPYLSKDEMIEIEPELLFEPNIALYGGISGSEISIKLIKSISSKINVGGRAFFETSPECINEIFSAISNIKTIKDCKHHLDDSGNPRIIDISF